MIDITSVGTDIGLYDTETTRAKNILSVQLGALEYAQDLGIDLKYFLSDEFQFQNESFKNYLIETLAASGINVASVIDTMQSVFAQYTFNIKAEDKGSGLIAR